MENYSQRVIITDGDGNIVVPSSPTGQQTSANSAPVVIASDQSAVDTQDASDGPASPGTAATKSMLVGGVYNSTAPTLTNGQQVAAQFDAAGNLLVNVAVGGGSGGGGGGGAVTIADGADVTQGAKADAAWSGSGSGSVAAVLKAIWTKLGSVVLGAGSAIVGKVGIDQTTPGTTNGVVVNGNDVRTSGSTITAVDTGTTTTSGNNAIPYITGTPTPNSFVVQNINGVSCGSVTIAGTFVASLQFELSGDNGATYVKSTARQRGGGGTSGPAESSTTGVGLFDLDLSGKTQVRVRCTSFTSGSATVAITASQSTGPVQIQSAVQVTDNVSNVNLAIKPASTAAVAADASAVVALSPNSPLGAGTNIIGKVGIDQTTPGTTNGVSLAQINAATTLAGAGATGTGAQRVTVAQDTSTIAGSAPGTAGSASSNVLTVQGVASMTPVQTQPATASFVSGTTSTTGTSTTSLIGAVSGNRIYCTAFSCVNTGATATVISFQDGSGGATLWTTIIPAGGGSNMDGNTPLFRTTSGNGLYFVSSGSETTTYVSAAGFSGA